MTCIHCGVHAPLPGGGVYCRICALGGRTRQRGVSQRPWWQWPSYAEIDLRGYLIALVTALQSELPNPLALSCRPAGAPWMSPAAIRILRHDILGSSGPVCAFCHEPIYGEHHTWHTEDGRERCPRRVDAPYPFHQPSTELP